MGRYRRYSLSGKTHTGKHNTNNKASLKTENGEEKIRNVDGVAKHNITKLKSVLQRELHAITVIKLDTGLEHAAAVDQRMRCQRLRGSGRHLTFWAQ